jgi:50S ribosomal subunit-associated GTPase HflX
LDRVDEFERAVPISALAGEGIPTLLSSIEFELYQSMSQVKVLLPYKAGRLISLFHETGRIDEIQHNENAVMIEGRIPTHLASQYTDYHI